MQVIIQAQSGKQPNSESWAKLLNNVCIMRRFHPHGKALSLADELALKVAKAFHEWRAKVAVKGRDTFEDFAQGPFKVRLAVGVEGADQLRGVRGGYAILNGELLAFSNLDRGRGAWMFRNAMEDGAIFFDAFENSPSVKHAKFYGYVEYARVPNYLGEQHPDVVYMCKPEHFQRCRRQWEDAQKTHGGTVTGRTSGKVQPQFQEQPVSGRQDFDAILDRMRELASAGHTHCELTANGNVLAIVELGGLLL